MLVLSSDLLENSIIVRNVIKGPIQEECTHDLHGRVMLVSVAYSQVTYQRLED